MEPIVYYVDSGVPEPIRSALLEGAGWWSEAFEAAGFINGFVVKELPEGADPLDARYNVINWVHRSTRGWSYGASITDPRTGEIIKGHVSLGSLRIRQDYLIATALTAPYGDEEKLKAAREMALARIRQLSAHEVGHTIGLKHNYSASTDNDSSVMDYPHPHVRLAEDGSIDITDAYDTGIGEWDIQAVKYGYSQFQENEAERLAEVLQETREMDLLFLSDPEARPAGSVHPEAHLWDNASNAVERLREIMQIRATALKNFDEKVVAPGTPMSRLEQALVPLFYFHRYQTEAAVKLIGGFRYNYAVRGENELQLIPVSPLEQRQAMEAVLETLDPAALTLSERLLRLIPPPAAGYGRDRESMPGNAFVLDRVAIGRSAAAMTLGLLLNPQRLNRLAEADAMHENYYGLGEMLDDLFEYTWETELPERVDGAVARAIRLEVIDSLIRAAQNAGTHDNARAVITNRLRELALEIDLDDHIYSDEESYQVLARKRIDLFLEEPGEYNPGPQPPVPPGSPIG